MQLPLLDAEKYLYMVIKHQAIIRSTAEVFKQLAHLTKGIRRLTNVRGCFLDGTLLHVDSIADLALQESAGLPGFGGQLFIENTYKKVRQAKMLIEQAGASTLIEIDGGVSLKNAKALVEAGADALVAGSFVFNAANPTQTIADLKHI